MADLALSAFVDDIPTLEVFGGRRGLTELSVAVLTGGEWRLTGSSGADHPGLPSRRLTRLDVRDAGGMVRIRAEGELLAIDGTLKLRRFMASAILGVSFEPLRDRPLSHVDFNRGADEHWYDPASLDLTVSLSSDDFT
jgi:hypothetical protein